MKSLTRFYTTLVGLLLTVSNPLTAVTIKGIIVKNEKGGPGIGGVAVGAIGDASPKLSNSDGSFSLEFPKKEPGDIVQLHVQSGMTVVNAFELRVTLTKASNAAPLILLLCRDVDLSEMRSRYYDVVRADTHEQGYRRKFEDSEAKKRAVEAVNEQLRIQLDIATKAAAALKEERVKAEELFNSNALSVSPIYHSYEAIAWNRAATLYRRENRPEEALKAYDEALKVSRKTAQQDPKKYLPDVVDTLNNRGDMLSEQNRWVEAWKDFDEALKISRDLAQKNATYLPDVAITLSNLGTLYHKQKQTKEERDALDEALRLYRGLAQLNPTIYRPHVAKTLNRLGLLNLDKNYREEKRKAFSEALSIYQSLERDNPAEYGQEVDTTIGLLEEFFNEALESYRDLAKLDPGYRPRIAETLNNLGNLNLDKNRFGKARKSFSEAFGIYVNLAQEDLDEYGQRALDIHGTLARINPTPYQQEFESNGRVLKAAFNEVLKRYRKQAQLNPKYRPNVAETLIDLGTLARDLNRMAEALDFFGEALAILEALAEENPGIFGQRGPYDGKVRSTRSLLDDLTKMQKP